MLQNKYIKKMNLKGLEEIDLIVWHQTQCATCFSSWEISVSQKNSVGHMKAINPTAPTEILVDMRQAVMIANILQSCVALSSQSSCLTICKGFSYCFCKSGIPLFPSYTRSPKALFTDWHLTENIYSCSGSLDSLRLQSINVP